MAYNIFISSNNKDIDLARDLAKRLEKAGVTAITSTGKIDNPQGVKERVDSLKKVDEVVFLLTTNSVGGKKLLFDMGAASSEGKRLTPITLGLKPKELPDIISGLDIIKYEDLESYISKLQQMIEEASKTAAKPQPKPGEP
jgi:hypothetical protein